MTARKRTPRKAKDTAPVERVASVGRALPAGSVDPARLAKMQRLYAIAGDPECAEEFAALRAELAAG